MRGKHLIRLACIAVFLLVILSGCKPHEHVYGLWTVTEEATCTTEGVETRTCECGVKETRPVSKKTHTYGIWKTTKEATCTTEGVETRTCECGAKETRSVNKKTHTYGSWKTTKEATCSSTGKKERTCSQCNHRESANIEKTAHTWTDATCAKPKTCSVCGATEGSTLAHGYPNSNFKCSVCNQDVDASCYQYLAGSDFRSIRADYSYAVASYATMIMYRDSLGDVCVLIKVYYKIGSGDFSDLFLHNFTKNQTIQDPETYYEKLKDRAFGNTKLMYMNLLTTLTEMQIHMLKNEYTHTVSGDYLNK